MGQDGALAASCILGCPQHNRCPCCSFATWFDTPGLQSWLGQGSLALVRAMWHVPPGSSHPQTSPRFFAQVFPQVDAGEKIQHHTLHPWQTNRLASMLCVCVCFDI